MKIKTQDLIGPALDWAVAQCEIVVPGRASGKPFLTEHHVYLEDFIPSYAWSQGGPIIERELIRVISPTVRGVDWVARVKQPLPKGMNGWYEKHGPTPLIAAMRCYCCATLGDEVDIPQELQPCQQPNL